MLSAVRYLVISTYILCNSYFLISAQEKSFSVNKNGTGYYIIECKSVPNCTLTCRLTGLNKQVALSPNPTKSFLWRKSLLEDGYFYLDCMDLPIDECRLSARSTLGAYFTTTGLEGNSSDMKWRLIPSDEPDWWMLEHKASGKFLTCSGENTGLTEDKSLGSAIKWKMSLVKFNLEELQSPILLEGDDKTAFRDPILIYKNGVFRLFYSLAVTEEDEKIFWHIAESKSEDMVRWSKPRILTVKDQSKNFTDPGSIVWHNGQWILSFQSYPMPGYTRKDNLRFGNENSRAYIMKSSDMENWSEPEMLYVKGKDVDPGQMINGYILEDKNEKGKWWCFYKQNGASCSYSYDLINWVFFHSTGKTIGDIDVGEAFCIWSENNKYFMMHSPKDGMGILSSENLKDWKVFLKPTLLGKNEWPWASQRLTAGYILDLSSDPRVGKYIMVFHGQGDGHGTARNTEVINSKCNIAIAWSDDLINWDWPGKR